MKLNKLYNDVENRVFVEYMERLKNLLHPKLLSEGKRVVVTTEIIDDDDNKVKQEAKDKFIEDAQKIGKFDNPNWVKQLINGIKQAGVQGVDNITEEERPVTANEIRQLVRLLVDLVRS